MASAKIMFISAAFLLLLALSIAAPAEELQAPAAPEEKQDLVAAEKEDLKPAASHWGGWGGYGGYGGGWGGYGGHWGGHYPYYGSYWGGYPSYGFGYGYGGGWPYYGGYYGHQGYWW